MGRTLVESHGKSIQYSGFKMVLSIGPIEEQEDQKSKRWFSVTKQVGLFLKATVAHS